MIDLARIQLLLATVSLMALVSLAPAQDGPPPHITRAVDDVLAMLDSHGDDALANFVDRSMTADPGRDRTDLVAHLGELRDALRGLRDDVRVEAEPDGVRIILAAGDGERHLRVAIGPEGISNLSLAATPAQLDLTRDNLVEVIDALAQDGWSGLIALRLADGFTVERPFGMANRDLGVPNDLDTVFGVGSRPIDFTIAAIALLVQQGHLGRDWTVDRIFPDVPEDKRTITIDHLLTGRSGLPDFFDNDDDWDPDLAWVDRLTAERRLLTSELLFVPGTGREHSHGAFGLLAAVIERVAEVPYEQFLREHFFDPAGMTRTGNYGDARDLDLDDFAAGGGPSLVGLPNIPPNWGPTSWLVKGSGGMYSTLGDLRRFYDLVRSGEVLDARHARPFQQLAVNLDGSDRGFELFSVHDPAGKEAYLFLNEQGDRGRTRRLCRALERLVLSTER